jgi:hypothetical protein
LTWFAKVDDITWVHPCEGESIQAMIESYMAGKTGTNAVRSEKADCLGISPMTGRGLV